MAPNICPNCGNEILAGAEGCERCRKESGEKTGGAGKKEYPTTSAWICAILASAAVISVTTLTAAEGLSFALPEWTEGALFLLLMGAIFGIPTTWIMSVYRMVLRAVKGESFNGPRAMKVFAVNTLALIIGGICFQAFLGETGWKRTPDLVCGSNLVQLGGIVKLYADENDGRYPFIDNTKNNFIFEGDLLRTAIIGRFAGSSETKVDSYGSSPLSDYIKLLACPMDPDYHPSINFRLTSNERHPEFQIGDVHPDCLTDFSYCYLGWIVTSDEEMEAFLEAYDRLSPEDYDKDIVVSEGKGNGGGNIIYRLDRKLFTTAGEYPGIFLIGSGKWGRDIPVMWDKPSLKKSEFNHRRYRNRPPYGNVVHLDGHAEEIPFPGKFPMTEKMARLLDERPRAPIPDCE